MSRSFFLIDKKKSSTKIFWEKNPHSKMNQQVAGSNY